MRETFDGSMVGWKIVNRHILIAALVISVVITLTGCAARMQNGFHASASSNAYKQDISDALLGGKPDDAREIIMAALRVQPQNGYLHLLNGLTYQFEGNSLQSLELAKVGYDAALKFCPGYFWTHYIAGLSALESQNYATAAEQFSLAILDEPDRHLAFLGLAVSAYFARDLGVARAASDRAITLAPSNPIVLKTAAYIAAARGDRPRLDTILAQAKGVTAAARGLESHQTRLTQLLRTAALEQTQSDSAQQQMQSPPVPPVSAPAVGKDPTQVMVEVTVLLNQNSTSNNTGINLLDGLVLQFGLKHDTSQQRVENAIDGTTTSSRTFTTSLSIPQINYSLNLFNRKSDYYQVIARPSLVASLGQQSEFFIGKTVTVGVSGVNLGSLQPVDVGTSVKVLPAEITREQAKFKVDVLRSFFAQEAGGTFAQSLTTFKQSVGATVDVDFGKTLILSAMYEGVDVGASSKTPLLGDIPVVDTLFNARSAAQRRDAALVLVTPRLPGFADTDTGEFRSETLKKLLSLWKDVVDPASSIDAIIDKVGGGLSRYFKAKAGDLRLPSLADPDTVKSVVNETIARLQ